MLQLYTNGAFWSHEIPSFKQLEAYSSFKGDSKWSLPAMSFDMWLAMSKCDVQTRNDATPAHPQKFPHDTQVHYLPTLVEYGCSLAVGSYSQQELYGQ